ncbi:glucose-methanol-choline oxidoreductase [Aspergillus pseudoustus]|uniref:Glucose-methanol-choline oxidoreductase n=1 Tax=Aspergillus pseudoustus TaxID=1810923 RepID=A0ABR4JYI3_9EURO
MTMLAADYVIVGGGTAGLVIASRLSEDPNTSVIVLEAGKDLTQDPRVQIPAMFTTIMSEADYGLASIPQGCLNNRVLKTTQGKALGGSSAINGMAFIPPTKAGIDAWATLGATGWAWGNLQPYYKKCYTLQLPDHETQEHIGLDWLDANAHGTTGPVKVSFPAQLEDPLAKAWNDTFKSLGFGAIGDPFLGKSLGGHSNLASVDAESKTRSYAAPAYGDPAVKRGVQIVTEALVQRILFNGTGTPEVVAHGVEVTINGQIQTVRAKREVILSAGAFGTPKILELSGIGNEELLRQLNIPVTVHNPNVGENLQDHLMTGVSFEAVDGVVTADPLLRQEPEAIGAAMQQYTEQKKGPMTIGGIQSSASMPVLEFHASNSQRTSTMQEYIDTLLSNPDDRSSAIRDIFSQPNEPTCMMFMFLAQADLHDDSGGSFVGSSLQKGNFISLGLETNLPFSRGSVHITSTDISTKQTVDPRYFSHPLDLEIMARNLLDVERLQKAAPLSNYIKPNGRRNHPDAFLTDLQSAKKYILDTAKTAYHFCGTCAMLPHEKGGVVDDRLKVYGVANLRICDASVFPLIPAANTMSSVYAVAERGADIIRGRI